MIIVETTSIAPNMTEFDEACLVDVISNAIATSYGRNNTIVVRAVKEHYGAVI